MAPGAEPQSDLQAPDLPSGIYAVCFLSYSVLMMDSVQTRNRLGISSKLLMAGGLSFEKNSHMYVGGVQGVCKRVKGAGMCTNISQLLFFYRSRHFLKLNSAYDTNTGRFQNMSHFIAL